jgi:GH35 family endo-1,4-beta-xylanase
LELCCADVHPQGCAEMLNARHTDDLVEVAREHGARVHGFTPVWYSQQRLADMAAVGAASGG